MKSQPNKRRALIAMLIVTLVFTVLCIGASVAYIIMVVGDFQAVLMPWINSVIELFTYPFQGDPSQLLPLILSISSLVVAALFVYMIVFGIIYVCIKKKPGFIAYVIMLLVGLVIGLVTIARGQVAYELIMGLFKGSTPIAQGIFVIAMAALAILSFIFIVITYIMGMVYAGRRQEVKIEEKADAIAENAEDPEVVQEAEEIKVEAPVEPIVVESEPEPEPEALPEPEEEVTEEPVEEPAPEEEPQVQPEPAPQHVEVNVNNAPSPAPAPAIDQNQLASLLREVVRDIVRDEIARNNANQPQQVRNSEGGNQTITGATFGGPLVVQYFNGGINGVTQPSPAPQAVEQKVEPAPVEEKKEEPAPVEEVKEEPQPEPVSEPVVEEKPRPLFQKKEEAPAAPVVEAAPAPEAPKYERLTFAERLLQSDSDLHDLYNEIKNEILSYGVKSRISANGDTFRLHKKMYVRITVAGKSLKLYFALNPEDYANSTIPVQDASNKDMYQDIPLVFKVKSGLSVRRCKELIQDVMEKDGLEQGEVGKVNWIKELKAEMKAAKKKEAE